MAIERGGEEAPTRRSPQQRRKAVNMPGKNLRKVREAAILSVFFAFVRKLETRVREVNQADLYKRLQMMNSEGKWYLI